MYTTNPSSARAAADQRRRYIREGVDLRHEVTSSFGDYGKSRLMPELISDLETRTRNPTIITHG